MRDYLASAGTIIQSAAGNTHILSDEYNGLWDRDLLVVRYCPITIEITATTITITPQFRQQSEDKADE